MSVRQTKSNNQRPLTKVQAVALSVLLGLMVSKSSLMEMKRVWNSGNTRSMK